MPAVGEAEVARHALPVVDLRAGKGVRFILGGAPGLRLSIEVLELRGDLPDDAGLTLGGQFRQREIRADETVPVTHRPCP
jgi:hypothetical protein